MTRWPDTVLSENETDYLMLRSLGLHRQWIAAFRGVAPLTVKSTLARARMKLGARGTTNAIAIAIREGLL